MKYHEQRIQISSVRSCSGKDHGLARGNLFYLMNELLQKALRFWHNPTPDLKFHLLQDKIQENDCYMEY